MASTKRSVADRGSRALTDAEIIAQAKAGRRREREQRSAGLRARAARYDRAEDRNVLELTNGVALAVPARLVPGLDDASAAERSRVELTPSGDGMRWPALDMIASVPGLLSHALGRRVVAQALGLAGGAVRSEAKTRAARANGARGGRPRKHVA